MLDTADLNPQNFVAYKKGVKHTQVTADGDAESRLRQLLADRDRRIRQLEGMLGDRDRIIGTLMQTIQDFEEKEGMEKNGTAAIAGLSEEGQQLEAGRLVQVTSIREIGVGAARFFQVMVSDGEMQVNGILARRLSKVQSLSPFDL